MNLHAFRLEQGEDLRKSLTNIAKSAQLQSGVVISVVGSLEFATLRMPGAQPGAEDVKSFRNGPYEIVSCVGTLTGDGGSHLHLSIADKAGQVYGGHLKDGCHVHTTAEVVIGEDKLVHFRRAVDPKTGFEELIVKDIG